MHKIRNRHMFIRAICLCICLLTVIFLFCFDNKVQSETNTQLSNVFAKSEDGAIVVEWIPPYIGQCKSVTVVVADGEKTVFEKTVGPLFKHIAYTEGTHGKLYTVSVTANNRDGTKGETVQRQALFLNYDKLPDLPVISINTSSGEDPGYEVAEKTEEGVAGDTISNNEYVSGEMVMSGTGIKSISMGMKVKIRGNTSSAYTEKKSYGIRLDDACDLLNRGGEGYSCKEWVLLNGRFLNTYIGDYVAALCGMDWHPEMRFVNVILNGDWKGCYCLTEAVCLQGAHGQVSESGYIFENDAYWWNADGVYFKTENQSDVLGYTFKYPAISGSEASELLTMKNYMQEFENLLFDGNSLYQNYIDEASFAKYFLVRDIVGNCEGFGGNMYLYKYDYDPENPFSSKVKMGPVWDFDGAFTNPYGWSDSRYSVVFYFPQFYKQDSFRNVYTDIWKSISGSLNDDIKEVLNELETSHGQALDASWELDKARWGGVIALFEEQKSMITDWLEKHVIWMNNELGLAALESTAIDTSDYVVISDQITYDIDDVRDENGVMTYSGWAYITDMMSDAEYGEVGMLIDGKVFLANETSHPYAKEVYGISSDNVGFYISVGMQEGEMCIVDRENKLIYKE